MTFANSGYLFLLLLLIPYIVWYFMSRKNDPTLKIPDTYTYRNISATPRQYLIHVPFFLRILTLTMMILVLARPQTSNHWKNSEVQGIDIMLSIDVSTSMLAKDLSPNRIEAAKNVATEFISGRPDDNIGLTIFAGESFTQCPMTTDHQTLINMLQNVRTDIAARGLIEDGTAVGMGLANAVGRLEKSKTKSKIVILLTDGSNNRGDISPITAADIAKSLGIRVYTIGVGTNDIAYYPMTVGGIVQDVKVPVEIDEETLKKIAETTDGHYYRATNTKELKQIYKDIDKLEKTKLEAKKYRKFYDAYLPFAIVAFCMLLMELILRTTILKREP